MVSNPTVLKLGPNISQDDVERVIWALGYRLSNIVSRTELHPAQSIFVSTDRQTLLHLIFDAPEERAVIARGEAPEQTIVKIRNGLAGETISTQSSTIGVS